MQGKPYAGNPHVRFDEGAGAPRHSGRSALLYKTAKFWMYLLFLLALALAWAPDARAASETVNGITWNYTVSNGKATLTKPAVPKNTTGAITIPSTLGGCPVTDIGIWAFKNCTNLTSVTIGNGVTNIGEQAFKSCSGLVSLTIPDSVTSVGFAAFSGCSGLTSMVIPDGVTSIGPSAFAGCVNLTDAEIPAATNATGIVNIIAEVTASNAVAIAQDWAAQYPGFEAAFGSDFTAALTMETGKRDGSGRVLRVWQACPGAPPKTPSSTSAASPSR